MAVLERRPDQLGGVALKALTIRPEEDHDLGGVRPARAGSRRAEAVDQPRTAKPADGVEAIGLDPDQQPHIAGQRPALDDLRHGNIGIEEHRAGVSAYGVDDVVLDRALCLGAGRKPGRLQHLDQRVAVIGSDDGEPPGRICDPHQGAYLCGREIVGAILC